MVFYLDLDYNTTVCTETLNGEALHAELLDILSLLAANDVKMVKMLFADNWGVDYRDFVPFEINVSQVPHEVLRAEFSNVGTLGKDDLLIEIEKLQTALLFSRDGNIKLCFNRRHVVIDEILNEWSHKQIRSIDIAARMLF